jgi:hypothetical protein
MVRTKKKEERNFFFTYQQAQHTSSWTQGLEPQETKRRTTKGANHVGKYHKTKYMEQVCLSIRAYTQKIRL